MLAKSILDYNEATRKANERGNKRQAVIINLKGLAMGNAWTDPKHDNTATVSELSFLFVTNAIRYLSGSNMVNRQRQRCACRWLNEG